MKSYIHLYDGDFSDKNYESHRCYVSGARFREGDYCVKPFEDRLDIHIDPTVISILMTFNLDYQVYPEDVSNVGLVSREFWHDILPAYLEYLGLDEYEAVECAKHSRLYHNCEGDECWSCGSRKTRRWEGMRWGPCRECGYDGYSCFGDYWGG